MNDQEIPPEEHIAASPSSIDEAAISSEQCSELPESILKTHDLSLSYGAHQAVDHLNLNVNRGEIYGFLGRNGAGKTSTIRMIMGICRPDSGTIEFDSKQLRRIGKSEKQKIGYVSQEQFFYTWMTCRRIGKFVGGLYPTWNADEFNRLLSAFDLPENRRISHLSGGMKVKLALALALAHHPDILILDEPTAGLDPVARREFLDIIRVQARQHQRTTFFSSHLIDEVEQVSDRVGIIHRGRLRFEGRLDSLRDEVREIQLPSSNLSASFDESEPPIEDSSQHPSDAMEQLSRCELEFLRNGFKDTPTRLFKGSKASWQKAAELGYESSALSLEDAFIALASENVGSL